MLARLLILLVLTSSLGGLIFSQGQWLNLGHSHEDQYFSITFLDVGQGDAILIQTPDGVNMLVDGGPDGAVLRELSRELPLFDTKIDLVVSTHPDKDHIGGLVDVLAKYEIKDILMTENSGESNLAKTYHEALENEQANIHYARAGEVYTLGASTTVTVYSPTNDPSMLESNASSIVLKVTYGTSDFLLTGDAPIGVEDYLAVTYGEILDSEVLKLGHHGSKTSSSELFLQTVSPSYAIVSAGLNNSYGHPHKEVLERVGKLHSQIINTAEEGAIRLLSDGTKIWRE
jgi:competence protein ComEC